MNRASRHGALALAWLAATACTSDQERSSDGGSEQTVEDAGTSTPLDGGELDALDAGDAMVHPQCAALLEVPIAELLPRYRGDELPMLPFLYLGRATSKVTLHVSLSSDAAAGAPFDPAMPAATSNYSTSLDVLDSFGVAHRLTVYFARIPDGRWEWHAMVDGASLVGGTPGVPIENASGLLSFDGGVLTQETVVTNPWEFFEANPQVLDFEFGGSDGGASSSVQRPGPSATTFVQHDGFAYGTLERLEVAPDGMVTGVFADGARHQVGTCYPFTPIPRDW